MPQRHHSHKGPQPNLPTGELPDVDAGFRLGRHGRGAHPCSVAAAGCEPSQQKPECDQDAFSLPLASIKRCSRSHASKPSRGKNNSTPSPTDCRGGRKEKKKKKERKKSCARLP